LLLALGSLCKEEGKRQKNAAEYLWLASFCCALFYLYKACRVWAIFIEYDQAKLKMMERKTKIRRRS